MASEVDIKNGKEKEILAVQDECLFTFDTGDTYDGFFEAKKKDRSAKRHGVGVYTTAEGDVYSGVWDSDKLGANAQVEISYTDGAKYQGSLKDWCYCSRGKYIYADNSICECEFIENCPVGQLQLTDPNGHIWLGKADRGFGWLSPVNHYFSILEKARDPTSTKRFKNPKPDQKKSRKIQ